MKRSNERASATLRARRPKWKAAGLIGFGALALGFAAGLPAQPAQAQFLRWWWWHKDEGPPPIPPGYVGHHHHQSWRDVEPMPRHPVSLAEMRHKASGFGLRLLGTPHRQGRVFVAFGEDSRGVVHHLAFDAYEGTLVENETTSIKAKTIQAKAPKTTAPKTTESPVAAAPQKVAAPPQAPAPASSHPAPAMTASAATPPPQTPPAPTAAPSTPNDRDLSPIRPQPGSDATPSHSDK